MILNLFLFRYGSATEELALENKYLQHRLHILLWVLLEHLMDRQVVLMVRQWHQALMKVVLLQGQRLLIRVSNIRVSKKYLYEMKF